MSARDGAYESTFVRGDSAGGDVDISGEGEVDRGTGAGAVAVAEAEVWEVIGLLDPTESRGDTMGEI